MNIEVIKPPEETFQLNEALLLMHCTVMPKSKVVISPDDMGVVQGVLDVESEIEVLVRSITGLKTYNKEDFEKEWEVYE